jgi:carnitine 3-dehydrogenase
LVDPIGSLGREPPGNGREISRIGIVGGGNIGAAWAALFISAGYGVVIHDSAPGTSERVCHFIEESSRVLAAAPSVEINWALLSFGFLDDVAQADFVIEAGPENLEVKRGIIRAVDAISSADVIIGSSTGGFPISQLQNGCRHPERVILFHPLNPAHLMPVVEIGGGGAVADWAVCGAKKLLSKVGKDAIVLRKESVGHLTNRLQAAILREAAHCLITGVASPEDIDKAVTLGLGIRWAAVGPLMTMHLAGGPGGMAGILAHAGAAIQGWWDDLGTPRLDEETSASLIRAAEVLSADRSIAALAAERDAALVRLVKVAQGDGENSPAVSLHETA